MPPLHGHVVDQKPRLEVVHAVDDHVDAVAELLDVGGIDVGHDPLDLDLGVDPRGVSGRRRWPWAAGRPRPARRRASAAGGCWSRRNRGPRSAPVPRRRGPACWPTCSPGPRSRRPARRPCPRRVCPAPPGRIADLPEVAVEVVRGGRTRWAIRYPLPHGGSCSSITYTAAARSKRSDEKTNSPRALRPAGCLREGCASDDASLFAISRGGRAGV